MSLIIHSPVKTINNIELSDVYIQSEPQLIIGANNVVNSFNIYVNRESCEAGISPISIMNFENEIMVNRADFDPKNYVENPGYKYYENMILASNFNIKDYLATQLEIDPELIEISIL